MPSTYFITGCNGLIGSYLAKALLQRGDRVKALKRAKSDLSLLGAAQHQIEWLEGELHDGLLLEKGVQGADYVIHAAAVVSFSPADDARMMKVNVQGTADLVNICLQYPIKKFVQISSVAAIGKGGQTQRPLDETTLWDGPKGKTLYAISKYESEKEAWRGFEEGLPVVVVNPSLVLGPGNWQSSSLQLIQYAAKGAWFYPTGCCNYIDARDLTAFLLQLIDSDVVGERFILSGGSVSYQAFFREVAQRCGAKPPTLAITPVLRSVALWLHRLQSLMMGKPPRISKESLLNSAVPTIYNGEKVKKWLSVHYRGLSETLDWVCQHYLDDQQRKGADAVTGR